MRKTLPKAFTDLRDEVNNAIIKDFLEDHAKFLRGVERSFYTLGVDKIQNWVRIGAVMPGAAQVGLLFYTEKNKEVLFGREELQRRGY